MDILVFKNNFVILKYLNLIIRVQKVRKVYCVYTNHIF